MVVQISITTDTRRRINVGLMLVHSLRRWTNVKALIQRLVCGGICLSVICVSMYVYGLVVYGDFPVTQLKSSV